MTDQQLQILQHSLGRDEYGRRPATNPHEDYRNYFVTDPNTVDYPVCRDLESLGLMGSSQPPTFIDQGSVVFHVTDDGVREVERLSPKPPKLSRSKQRYQQYLDSECSESFGEYLKHRMYERYEKPDLIRSGS